MKPLALLLVDLPRIAFRQAARQQWFDRQLSRMKEDGRYERIFAAYGASSSYRNIKASP